MMRRADNEQLFAVQIATNQISEGIAAGLQAVEAGADFVDLSECCPLSFVLSLFGVLLSFRSWQCAWAAWGMAAAGAGAALQQRERPHQPPCRRPVPRACALPDCGCPIYEATRRGLGAALLRKPKKLARLVNGIAKEVGGGQVGGGWVARSQSGGQHESGRVGLHSCRSCHQRAGPPHLTTNARPGPFAPAPRAPCPSCPCR